MVLEKVKGMIFKKVDFGVTLNDFGILRSQRQSVQRPTPTQSHLSLSRFKNGLVELNLDTIQCQALTLVNRGGPCQFQRNPRHLQKHVRSTFHFMRVTILAFRTSF